MDPEDYTEIAEYQEQEAATDKVIKEALRKKIRSAEDLQDYYDSLVPDDEDNYER